MWGDTSWRLLNLRFIWLVAILGPVSRKSRHFSADIVLFVSSKPRLLEARNFALILIFNHFTTYEKTALQNKWVAVLRMAFRARKVFGTFQKQALNMSGSCHSGRHGFLSLLIVKTWPQRQLIRFTLSSFYVRTGSSNCVCRKSGRRGQDVTWPSDNEKDGRSCARWVQVNKTGTRLGWRSPKVGARLERLVYSLMLKLLDLILNSVIE